MIEILKLNAILVANQLDIKNIKAFFELKPLADSSSELFYSFATNKYQYYTNYGVVAFAGYTEEEIRSTIQEVVPFHKDPVKNVLGDEFDLRVERGREKRLISMR